MLQAIIGFHKDEEGHWVAELACGHGQHVRHDPPWQVREWVTTSEGRAAWIGKSLVCKLCEGAVGEVVGLSEK
jgi:uncharacterized protein DUF3565